MAMAEPQNPATLDSLRSFLDLDVKGVIVAEVPRSWWRSRRLFADQQFIEDVVQQIQQHLALRTSGQSDSSIDLETIKEMAEAAPVRKLLNLVLLQAIKDKASDIHFEPFEDEFKMRYRIDGVLYEMMPPPTHIAPAITSRIKVMANLDIAERRLPQDGRIELTSSTTSRSTCASACCRRCSARASCMRVLDRSNVQLDLDKIGLREDDLNDLRQLIHKPNGIVLVTGPTGSGKTTTLYSALRELNDITDKLITAEDPVEYDIDGIIQCQINPDIELTFAAFLRAILRQDPDIILVGEIRDQETAKIAVQASLTGHLVFTHAAHQRRPVVDRPSARSGPRAVPDHRDARRPCSPSGWSARSAPTARPSTSRRGARWSWA